MTHLLATAVAAASSNKSTAAPASTTWVDWSAAWRIVVYGLLFGACLPAVFAIGLRALSLPPSGGMVVASSDDDRVYGGNPLGLVAAVLCFAVVLAAIVWGIYFIVEG